jgi:regulator of sigma E protease
MLSALHGLIGWAPLGLPAFVFVVTVVVFFHELGHFSVARFFNVTVDTFSIGFGRPVVQWVDKKSTRWKIGWLPLGGYVKFLGDENAASQQDREVYERLPPELRANTLQGKPLYQRALIVAAGPFANFILTIVIFTFIFMIVGPATLLTTVGQVMPKSPAAIAGLRTGDTITSVNGHAVATFDDLVLTVRAAKGGELAVEYTRRGSSQIAHLHAGSVATSNLYGDHIRYTGIGIGALLADSNARFTPVGPVAAIGLASEETVGIAQTSLTYLWRIVTGQSGANQLSGTVGIANASKQAASAGFTSLFQLIALISVSIGLINLFPVPILDGGHLLYYGCEAILGRPLGERAQDVGFRLGLALVLGLFVLAAWNDLTRLNLF